MRGFVRLAGLFVFFFFRLAKEEELAEARAKAEMLEKENLEIVTKLAMKEQDLDKKTQEKVSSEEVVGIWSNNCGVLEMEKNRMPGLSPNLIENGYFYRRIDILDRNLYSKTWNI